MYITGTVVIGSCADEQDCFVCGVASVERDWPSANLWAQR
jgi:hypothetical protein